MRCSLTILAGLLCTSLALGQDTRTTTTVQFQRVSAVVGTTVTLGSETLGKVTEVVIDSDGCIEYLIVQYADGLVPIPWTVTTVNFEQRSIVIRSTDVTVEKLRELRFTQDRWPNFGDQRFTQQVRTVWGDRATRSGSSGTRKEGTERPGTPDRKAPPGTPGTPDRKDRPGTPGTPDRKDRPAEKEPPARPKDKDTGEKPKLDLPKQEAPRKEPPKKDGDRKEPERPKDKKDKDGGQ